MDTHLAAPVPSVADSLAPVSRQIWDAKYRFKAPDGSPIDATVIPPGPVRHGARQDCTHGQLPGPIQFPDRHHMLASTANQLSP